MNIISRAEWGARPPKHPPTLTVAQELYLHHSVGSGTRDWDGDMDMGDDYMRAMQNYHMDVQGWDDIAYNFAIDPDGLEVYEGRGWGIRPGSQLSHNTGTWSVVVMGNFSRIVPTAPLKARIAELVTLGQSLGHLPETALQGHRDAPRPPGTGTTTCPGSNLYAALAEINRLIGDDMVSPKDWTDEDKRAVGAAVWAGVLANGDPSYTIPDPGKGGQAVHPNTLLRAIRTDTVWLRKDALDGFTDEELAEVADAVNDELARRAAG